MNKKSGFYVLGLLVALVLATATVWANDEVDSTVTIPSGQPIPIIKNNGVETGTIQLWYTIAANSIPCGEFAQFNLNLNDVAGTGETPTYPVTLNLVQSGTGTPVQFFSASPLSPDPATFSVIGNGWTGSSLVTIFIDCAKLPSGSPYDGEDIVGNLNEQTEPQGSHLDTISTIQVHITLAMPDACLKLYSFETNQGSGSPLSAVTVVANKSGAVKSTNPGQASVDALVVNTCPEPFSFDLAVGLDPEWQTNPSNNPGNATFTYMTSGELDPTTDFSLITSLIHSGGTPQHEVLCLQNVTLPASSSFLTTVHSEINTGYDGGLTVPLLPSDGDFDFNATIFEPGTSCSVAYPTPSIISPSNPATSTLTYTVSH
jgi:hypothetical protein